MIFEPQIYPHIVPQVSVLQNWVQGEQLDILACKAFCNSMSAHMHQHLVYTSSYVNHPSLQNSARQIAFISCVSFV